MENKQEGVPVGCPLRDADSALNFLARHSGAPHVDGYAIHMGEGPKQLVLLFYQGAGDEPVVLEVLGEPDKKDGVMRTIVSRKAATDLRDALTTILNKMEQG